MLRLLRRRPQYGCVRATRGCRLLPTRRRRHNAGLIVAPHPDVQHTGVSRNTASQIVTDQKVTPLR